MAEYSLEPVAVARVATEYRRIGTKLPVPESLPIFEALRQSEPRSMTGMPPLVWESAEGFLVRDRWGNQWLDFSSGVLITNAGHGHPGDHSGPQGGLGTGASGLLRLRSPEARPIDPRAAAPGSAPGRLQGLSVVHRFGGDGELHQAGQDLRPQETRSGQALLRYFREGFPWPNHGRPTGRWPAQAKRLAGRGGPDLPAAPLPRRILQSRPLLRPFSQDPLREGRGAGRGRRGHDRILPGRRPRFPALGIRPGAGGSSAASTTSCSSSTRSRPVSAEPVGCSATNTTALRRT